MAGGRKCRGAHFGESGGQDRQRDPLMPAHRGGRSHTAFGPGGSAPRGSLAGGQAVFVGEMSEELLGDFIPAPSPPYSAHQRWL